MIVLSDADLERAANFATYYSMQNAGQTCISIERVYVEEPVYDEFVAKVSEKVRALRVGPPQGPGSVEVGAITFPPQLETIEDHVADAVDKGARVLAGGHAAQSDGGRFYEPTVLVDVDHTMKIMTEETFGPTLPIMKVADAEEAVRLANDSPYGLGSSVFTRDTERGEQIARRLRGRRGERQRRDDQLHGPRAADGRRQGLGPRLAPRRRAGSASTAPSRRSSSHRGWRSSARPTCTRTRAARPGCWQASSSSCTAAASATDDAASADGLLGACSGIPSSRSSCGIVVSALVWWTVAMPSFSAGVRLKAQVVDVHARSAGDAGALGAQLVHPARGLAYALLAGDHDAVEQLREQVVGVAVDAPRVRHERRAHARLARSANGVDHRRVGLHAGEQPVDQPLGLDAQQRGELLLEGGLVELPLLQRDQQLAGGGIRAEAPEERLRVDLRRTQ